MVARKPVPEPYRSKLVELTELLKTTRAERELMIVDALKAGGSIREVSELVGMNHRQVLDIGHAHGWPPDDERAQRAEDRRQAAIERRAMDDYRRSAEFQQALRRYERTPELERKERPRSWEQDDPFEDERS